MTKKDEGFLTPSSYLSLEDEEKIEKRKKRKTKRRVHVYWDEVEMVLLYDKIKNKKNNRLELQRFWEIVDTLIKKIYTSYASIRYYYHDKDASVVDDARSRIKEEIYTCLFVKDKWDVQRASLFTYLTIITKNWYMYYNIIEFNKTKDIVKNLEEIDDKQGEAERITPVYINIEPSEESSFVSKLQHVKDSFKEEVDPYKTIIDSFFEFISSEEVDYNKSFIRDVYNLVRFKNGKINSLQKEKDRFDGFSSYFIPYLKRKLSSRYLKKYKLNTAEDFLPLIHKSLKKIREALKKEKIIRS